MTDARSIDHAYVERNALLVRYRARQLSPEEADQFEIHYLDCMTCRSQLEEDDALAEGFKTAAVDGLTAQRTRRTTAGWLSIYALAASVLIVILIGLLVRRAEPASTQVLALMTTRQAADADVVPLVISERSELLVFVVDAVQPELTRYDVTVTDTADRIAWSARDLSPQQTLGADRLVVSIPAERLESGEMQLTVTGRGREGQAVHTGAFRLSVTRQP
jgi:hypothetical protein